MIEEIIAPTLKELKSRPCSLEELQAALVQLIDMYNDSRIKFSNALNKKEDHKWRATI
jgi:hypothetical protein